MTLQLQQLEQANQAWGQYQQHQLNQLRDHFQLDDVEQGSFDDILHQLQSRFHDLNTELSELRTLKSESS